jgi:pantoate--beta-alanine ligase
MLEQSRRPQMLTATTVAEVRAHVSRWHEARERVVFVPTMGNLHAGHVSLIEAARAHGKRFVASIFVNPMQFGPNEDFAHYPRTPSQDAQMLAAAGCDLMFSPEVGEIYPNGSANSTRIDVPGISRILCGEFRPGHFEGVATVVAKLFHIVDPDVAIFGEKDFQQLTVIRRMVADLCLRVEIVGAPTVREADGLAMSSRNQYLSAEQRRLAPTIHRQLRQAVAALESGVRDYARIEGTGRAALDAAGFRTDYFSVRDARTLGEAQPDTRQFAVLTAARLGKARLIDNLQWSQAGKAGDA